MHINKIAFFYPSKVLGGAELLFARLAQFLQDELNKKVFYVDYKDGFIRNNKCFSSLNYIDYISYEKTVLPDVDILITPISNIARINQYLSFENEETRLLFWSIHPLNLLHILPKGTKLQNCPAKLQKIILNLFYHHKFQRIKSLLLALNKHGACCFMDYENVTYQNNLFDINIENNYLPIACIEPEIKSNQELINHSEINICIVGRLVREKVFPLINVLDNLAVYETKLKKIVHIIGDGDSRELIECDKYKNKVEIRFTGTLNDISELHKYLKDHADIVFAMGTSVIEAAAMKIPSVILPYAYNRLKNTKFMYFFDSFDYVLGANPMLYDKIAKREFVDILGQIYKMKNKKSIGNDCYNHFLKHHSISAVANRLLDISNINNLSYKVYKELLNK